MKDGAEVKGVTNRRFDRTFTSGPLVVDTDGGGVSDPVEIQEGSNPVDRRSGPRNP